MKHGHCAFCEHDLEMVSDFGNVALAGAFLKPEQFSTERTYPLRLMFCPACYVLQIADHVAPEVLFKNYFYFSSASRTVREHAKRYADDVVTRFSPKTALEIGCNDGVLLRELANLGVECTGVDPAANVTGAIDDARLNIVCDFFTKPVGKFDLVLANNVFAHVSDINLLTQNIADSLADGGVFVMEVHDLRAMVDGLQYDWIYHEHLYYYSAHALEKHLARFGLTIFDSMDVALHGGSKRYFIAKDRQPILVSHKLSQLSAFTEFAYRVKSHSIALRAHVNWIKRRHGVTVAGYGASGRANALIQYAHLDLDYMIDDAPAKHGYYTPASHIPIYNKAQLRKDDTVMLFAWTYASEIIPKLRNKNVIIPLPHVQPVERMVA